MPLEGKYAWLLSCGFSINKDPNPVRNNCGCNAESPFLAGKSISPIHGKKDSYINRVTVGFLSFFTFALTAHLM